MSKSEQDVVRVLHFSTHNEDCGIGKYQEQFMRGFGGDVRAEFFPYSPHTTKKMSAKQFTAVLHEMREKLRDFDILHIQHEFSFYWHNELERMIRLAHAMHKQVVITVHTAPSGHFSRPRIGGLGPRSMVNFAKSLKTYTHLTNVHLKAIRLADHVLVHNNSTLEDLVSRGVKRDHIRVVTLPVPDVSQAREGRDTSGEIRKALHYKHGDVILASVGFVSPSKGIDHALKALTLLPATHKLAIVGGVHPNSLDQSYLDRLCDLARELGVSDRLYITGYVEDDARLLELISECTVGIFPYDKKYYSYVTSGALSSAMAGGLPVVAYPTDPLAEMTAGRNLIALTKTGNYYELARTIRELDYPIYTKSAKEYALLHSYKNEAAVMAEFYRSISR